MNAEIGLALSGGGFRAALFHLGALWRLNELGLLSKLKCITSVSSGSITPARLAVAWPNLKWNGDIAINFIAIVAEPLNDFFACDLEPAASDLSKVIDNPAGGQMLSNQIVLTFVPDTSLDIINAIISRHAGILIGRIPELGVFQVELPNSADLAGLDQAIRDLSQEIVVQTVEPVYIIQTLISPNDPYYQSGDQWGLAKINIADAWNITTGRPMVIGIVDTGIRASHEDLAGRVIPGLDAVDYLNGTADKDGHGTMVAGIVGAAENNLKGIAGICWQCALLAERVLVASWLDGWIDRNTAQTSVHSAYGIIDAIGRGARILNLSYGSPIKSLVEEGAVEYALKHDTIVVAAAGNKAAQKPFFPAGFSGVIAVGSTTNDDEVSNFSNYGQYVDIYAPGSNIISTCGVDSLALVCDSLSVYSVYSRGNGSSYAAPHVTGVAALMRSVNPAMSPAQAKSILIQSADIVNTVDPSGAAISIHRLNAANAVALAKKCAIDPQGNTRTLAYIANHSSNNVSVVDTKSKCVIATIPVGKIPWGVTVNPIADRVYVTNVGDGTVSVIDAKTNTVTAVIRVGWTGGGIAVNPAGTRVYVSTNLSITVIDVGTNQVTTIPIQDSFLRDLAVSLDGYRLYYPGEYYLNGKGYDAILVMDLSTGSTVATVPMGQCPSVEAVHPAGIYVYVTDICDGAVSVIETNTNKVIATIPVGNSPRGLAVNPSGTRVYVTRVQSALVSVIDTVTNTVVDTVVVDSTPEGVAVTPDGSEIYVPTFATNSVSVIDAATDQVKAKIPVGEGPLSMGRFIGTFALP